MSNLRKSLLQFIFSGAYMKRWNDKLRPIEMYEVDKQAHKMIVAWLLFMLSSRDLGLTQKLKLEQMIIEGGIFDYLYRLVITDIKPPVFYKIKENKADFEKLSIWVLVELKHIVQPLNQDFWLRLENWVKNQYDQNYTDDYEQSLANQILQAAHLYASNWEFNILKPLNAMDDEIEEIAASFKEKLFLFKHIPGVELLLAQQDNKLKKSNPQAALGRFAELCGRLRFQIRWSQTPRIPETSVMGHTFIVACYAYFVSLNEQCCSARAQNNFFAGLFHDLPELLTRDIISPVKKSVDTLGSLIKEYEHKELNSRVFEPLSKAGYEDIAFRLSYLLGLEVGCEFTESIIQDNVVKACTFEELSQNYNHNHFDPKDGELLKLCDILAAFQEAYTAISNGIVHNTIREAMYRIKFENKNKTVGNFSLGALLADFE